MMEGALTGKTGYTGQAGYCYVGAVEQGEELYIVALLACGWPNHKTYKWSDMRKLITYGLEQYDYENVWQELPTLQVEVKDGIPKDGSPDGRAYVALEIDDTSKQLYVLLREGEEVQIKIQPAEYVTAPVEKGTVAGMATYLLDDEIIKSYPLRTKESVGRKDFLWYLDYVWNEFLFDGDESIQ